MSQARLPRILACGIRRDLEALHLSDVVVPADIQREAAALAAAGAAASTAENGRCAGYPVRPSRSSLITRDQR